MSAKIPRIPPRECWIDGDKGRTLWNGKSACDRAGMLYPRRVRVTDARDLTPEQAVAKVLQRAWDAGPSPLEWEIWEWAQNAGMTARVVNGKVRVRREKT